MLVASLQRSPRRLPRLSATKRGWRRPLRSHSPTGHGWVGRVGLFKPHSAPASEALGRCGVGGVGGDGGAPIPQGMHQVGRKGFCRRLHGRLRAVLCAVGEFLYGGAGAATKPSDVARVGVGVSTVSGVNRLLATHEDPPKLLCGPTISVVAGSGTNA